MALALEVKKFINSQHTGEYIDVVVPYDVEPAPVKKAKQTAEKEAPDTAPAQDDSAPEGANDAAAELSNEDFTVSEDGPIATETLKIHYLDEGSGDTIILVHAPGQSLYTWRQLFPMLAQDYRVIAIDLPGHGYSTRNEHLGYSIPEMARVLSAFMDAKEIASANFVGFSMASAYCLELAALCPEKVKRLAIVNPGGVTVEMPLSIRMLQTPFFGAISSTLFGIKTLTNCLNDCLFDHTVLTPDVINEYYATISDSLSRRAVKTTFAHYFEEDTLAKLRDIEQFVLVIHSVEDKWHSNERAEFYHAGIRNSVRTEIRNAGHLVQEEKPAKVHEAVTDFFTK
ncbi:MAG: alpha/beta hydrolase [Eubacteriales bacterium]|nr:alpha/beta hydrolase [Clostridia bacterium]MDY5754034.1 alpha/beta hydrolase [Eubacteriales bacterium]